MVKQTRKITAQMSCSTRLLVAKRLDRYCGSVMASLGLLGSMLGFTGEQQALMIAIYIAIDSFGTACNVTGDGALTMILSGYVRKHNVSEQKV